MTLPNFLVIGAQKSATTWLHEFLGSRNDVYVPTTRKELMFFDNEVRFSEIGIEGYERFFAGAAGHAAIGEVTPGYLWTSGRYPQWGGTTPFRQGVPRRVRDLLGSDIRLVAVLRNPIDRALSAFMHHRKKMRIEETAALRGHFLSRGIVHIGFYAAHLEHWASCFPRSNFHVSTYEALFADRTARDEILHFVGSRDLERGEFSKKMVHRGLGFIRNEKGAFDASGRQIASIDDIEVLREAYRADVAELRSWVDVSPWDGDFGARAGHGSSD